MVALLSRSYIYIKSLSFIVSICMRMKRNDHLPFVHLAGGPYHDGLIGTNLNACPLYGPIHRKNFRQLVNLAKNIYKELFAICFVLFLKHSFVGFVLFYILFQIVLVIFVPILSNR